jgi:hypothetical protein
MTGRRITTMVLVLALMAFASSCSDDDDRQTPASGQTQAQTNPEDWAAVGAALGIPGKLMEGGVYRISMPRRDLKVTAHGVPIKPSFALGSYAAFVGPPRHAMVMGDLVLLEDEVNPVLSGLQEAGLFQTALHRHLLEDEPAVMFMHYSGEGDATELARGIRRALETSATPLSPPPPSEPTTFAFATARLDEIIGYQGQDRGGVWGYTIGRAEPVRIGRTELPVASGVATVLNFQPLEGTQAAINGDFAMTAEEVPKVLRALRAAAIEIQSTHQHMTHDEPRIIYSHFWATGDAEDLARRLRTALDQMKLTG